MHACVKSLSVLLCGEGGGGENTFIDNKLACFVSCCSFLVAIASAVHGNETVNLVYYKVVH